MKYVICTLLLTVSVAACAQPPLMPATTDPCAPVVVPSLPRELNFAGEPCRSEITIPVRACCAKC